MSRRAGAEARRQQPTIGSGAAAGRGKRRRLLATVVTSRKRAHTAKANNTGSPAQAAAAAEADPITTSSSTSTGTGTATSAAASTRRRGRSSKSRPRIFTRATAAVSPAQGDDVPTPRPAAPLPQPFKAQRLRTRPRGPPSLQLLASAGPEPAAGPRSATASETRSPVQPPDTDLIPQTPPRVASPRRSMVRPSPRKEIRTAPPSPEGHMKGLERTAVSRAAGNWSATNVEQKDTLDFSFLTDILETAKGIPSPTKPRSPLQWSQELEDDGQLHPRPHATAGNGVEGGPKRPPHGRSDDGAWRGLDLEDIPLDWMLYSTLSFESGSSFDWCRVLGPQASCSAMASFLRDSSRMQDGPQMDADCGGTSDRHAAFANALLYFTHPAAPELVRLAQTVDSTKAVQTARRDWGEAFQSLFNAFSERVCPYFYLCSTNFTAVFCSKGFVDQPHDFVVINQSHRTFRESLKKAGVTFQQPLKGKKFPKSKRKHQGLVIIVGSSEGADGEDEEGSEDGDCGHNLFAFYEFVLNTYANNPSPAKSLPTLFAPCGFQNACIKSLANGLIGTRSRNERGSMAKHFMLEVSAPAAGPILPHCLLRLLNVLKRTQADGFRLTLAEEQPQRSLNWDPLEADRAGAHSRAQAPPRVLPYGQTLGSVACDGEQFEVKVRR